MTDVNLYQQIRDLFEYTWRNAGVQPDVVITSNDIFRSINRRIVIAKTKKGNRRNRTVSLLIRRTWVTKIGKTITELAGL